MSGEELKQYVIAHNRDEDDILKIIDDPNMTEDILKYAVDHAISEKVLSKILDSSLLSQELFNKVYDKNNYAIKSYELTKKILRNRFLMIDNYEFYLNDSERVSYIDELLNSPFTSEYTLLKLLEESYNLTSDNYISIINNSYFSSKVMDKIIALFPNMDDVVLACLKSRILTDEQFQKICERCDNSNNKESLKYIINDPRCGYDTIKDFVGYNDDNATYFLNSPNATTDNLKKLIDDSRSDIIPIILKSDKINNDLCLAAITRARPLSNTYKNKIINVLLERDDLSEDVLCELVKLNLSDANEKILKYPTAGARVKANIMINKSYLSNDEADEFFNIDGLTTEDIVGFLNKHESSDEFNKAINYSKATQELYGKIIELVEDKKSRSYSEFIELLLEKDLDEDNLCLILDNFQTDSSLAEKVLNHKNANLKVCEKINVYADKYSSSSDRDKIIEMSTSLKYNIISKIYNIEEENDVTEMLRVNIEDGMSTMLWGPSGVGKTSRVFEIDPTATLLILKNGMLPEEVIGGKEPNGEPGEIYPPHWYVVLCEKCNKEPDKKHILFIDEITNVNDTIKNLVWEVIGQRLVNGHEEWALPENCSIVVAGNRPEESTAVRIDANGGVMPGPLHNRIDSMIEIKFDVDEWQRWALETDKNTGNLHIHPIVYSFCIANADKVMFSNFNAEDVAQPFLTPRKWETLSKAIYNAEARGKNHHVSYARIYSILGDTDISNAFVAHYERLPIDINKIVMGTYLENDFKTIEDKLYALGMIIAEYDGDPFTIEAFILECLGDEYLSIYNNMKDLRNSLLGKEESKRR